MLAIFKLFFWFILFGICSYGIFRLNKEPQRFGRFHPLVYFLLILGTFFFSIFTREAYDNVKENPKSQLDGDAYVILGGINGLIFDVPDKYIFIEKDGEKYLTKKSYAEAINKLISLGLIRLEPYPSSEPSWSYLPTKKGREFIKNDLGRKRQLYREIFCDLYNFHWWKEGCPKRKELEAKFELTYGISYEKGWDILKELQPDFDNYLRTTPYNRAMKELVNPWLKKMEEAKQEQLNLSAQGISQ